VEEIEMLRILLITGNMNKAREISGILGNTHPGIFSIEVGDRVEKLEIQSESLREIAITALRTALKNIDPRRWHSVLVEDSGLFIEALAGFPGPFSSYVFKKIGIMGVLKLLEGVSHRRACYRAAVAFTIGDSIDVEEGEVCGVISTTPRGDKGFGFDPIFIPEGYEETMAELGEEIKNTISHRAIAIRRAARRIAEHWGIL
jgi:XTP/dITP diphosphohydrolase